MKDDKNDISPSEAARALSKLGAAKGGKARADKLPAKRKREIAKAGADARWKHPRAFMESKLDIGGVVFDCAVLEDHQTRVVSEKSFMETMGMYYSGWISTRREPDEAGAVVPLYLAYEKLKPFIDKHLGDMQFAPLKYLTTSGAVAHGIRAEIIPRICRVWLDARDGGGLGKRQKEIAKKADILLRGLGDVGILALVDEATGFQRFREGNALAKILEAFIAKELAEWVKTFEDDYYDEIYRLRGWERSTGSARTQLIGKITNDIVYDRLAPGVKDELMRITPRDSRGRLVSHLHRSLTRSHGYQALKTHLAVVVALMKVVPDREWSTFKAHLDRVKPRYGDTGLLDFQD